MDFNTALVEAAKAGDIDLVREALSKGANSYNTAMLHASLEVISI